MIVDEDWLDIEGAIFKFRDLVHVACEKGISDEVFQTRYRDIHKFAPSVFRSVSDLIDERIVSNTLKIAGGYINENQVVLAIPIGDFRLECRCSWGDPVTEEGDVIVGATAYHIRLRLYSEKQRVYNLRLTATVVLVHSSGVPVVTEGNGHQCEDDTIKEAFFVFQKLWKKKADTVC